MSNRVILQKIFYEDPSMENMRMFFSHIRMSVAKYDMSVAEAETVMRKALEYYREELNK